MISLVALDLVLRVIRRTASHMSLVRRVARMHRSNASADVTSFRVPFHVVTDIEVFAHGTGPDREDLHHRTDRTTWSCTLRAAPVGACLQATGLKVRSCVEAGREQARSYRTMEFSGLPTGAMGIFRGTPQGKAQTKTPAAVGLRGFAVESWR